MDKKTADESPKDSDSKDHEPKKEAKSDDDDQSKAPKESEEKEEKPKKKKPADDDAKAPAEKDGIEVLKKYFNGKDSKKKTKVFLKFVKLLTESVDAQDASKKLIKKSKEAKDD